MQDHVSDVSGKDGLFRAFHELAADPPAAVSLIDRKLPHSRNITRKSDQHASNQLAPVIYGNQMDLRILIAYILFGQVKPKGQSQDPVPQLFFQGILGIVHEYLVIRDHAAISRRSLAAFRCGIP